MANLKFERSHGMGITAAREAAQRLADLMTERYAIGCAWDGDVLRFERSGLRGTLVVSADRIELDARLGVLLAGFRPRIEEQLDQNFEAYFG